MQHRILVRLDSGRATVMPCPPGELHIKERRTWRTWQLATGMLVAALAGMALDYYTAGSSQSSTASNAPAYVVPKSTG